MVRVDSGCSNKAPGLCREGGSIFIPAGLANHLSYVQSVAFADGHVLGQTDKLYQTRHRPPSSSWTSAGRSTVMMS